MAVKLNQTLAHATGGRRFCFVIMSYHGGYAFFEHLRTIVKVATGCECIRADDIPAEGDLRGKIHRAIEAAAFVIADISDPRPNIYYEVGYAVARNKPTLFLARENVEIETDLHGVEVIRYFDTKEGLARLVESLRAQLAVHAESDVSLRRAMIVPQSPEPSYILAGPKTARFDSRFGGHPHERRTYGDYLGVVGVLGAFASVYGEHIIPEVLSASRAPDDLLTWDANLYLVGSFKVNPFTLKLLDAMQQGKPPNWQFQRSPHDEKISDFEVVLEGQLPSGPFTNRSRSEVFESVGRSESEDYGLIVRGPNPRYPERLVAIMAGPHSLGTGAACLAATRSQLIREIRDRLLGTLDLAAHDRTIWVLVKGKAADDLHIDPSGVSIVDAGVYPL